MKIKILKLILLTLGASQVADASIFKCVNATGTTEFRDRPCQLETEFQGKLPIFSQKTQIKVVRQEQALLKRQEKELNKEEKKTLRLQKKMEEQREKENRKAKRLELRCKAIREKIKQVGGRLRVGCSGKRAQRLREKELSLIAKEREVCTKS